MRPKLGTLLTLDFCLRLIGISCFALFITGIYTLTGSTEAIGIMTLATAAPALVATLLAGKLVGRFSPLGVLRLSIGGRIIVLASAAILADDVIVVVVGAALQSLFHQVSISAKMTLDAEILLPEMRRGYNSTKTILANIALIGGPPAGAVLVVHAGIAWSLAAMAAVSLVAVCLSLILRSPVRVNDSRQVSGLPPAFTLRYLTTTPATTTLIMMYCLVAAILGAQAPLLFPFVHEVYQEQSDFAGLLLGLCGVGGIAGGLLAKRFPKLFSERTLPWLVTVDGALFFLFTQIHSTLVACALFTTLGVMGAVTLIVVEGIVQQDVEPLHRPFVFSLMQFAVGAGGATLGVGAAFVAGTYGAKPTLAAAAIVEVAFGAFAWLYLRRMTAPTECVMVK